MDETANPGMTGSDVTNAASLIESQGLLEPGTAEAETAPPDTQDQTETAGEAQESPEDTATPEAEAEGKPEDKSADAEPEAETLELPETLDALSEALGLDADGLSSLKVNVKVNGETRPVTLADAVKGYQLEADYRHKTADLAEQRRAIEAQTQQASQEWQQRFTELQTLTEQLQTLADDGETDLTRILQEEGTEAYLMAQQKVEQRRRAADKAKQEQNKATEEARMQNEARFADYVSKQKESLLQVAPEFGDPKKAPTIQRELRSFLGEVGFSDQEIGGVVDHRMVLVARDAMRWRALKKTSPQLTKKLKTLPKVQKPGAKPGKGEAEARQLQSRVQALRKTGTTRAAAAFLEGIL